ncbi:MAG: PilZ domain-containing protein [Myxococcales bacterium]
MTEKRISRRVPLDVYLNKFINGVPFMARAKDISPEGIYLAQLLEPEAGEARVGVQFQLPGSKEVIYAEGEIVRDARRGKVSGNGVRFTLITDYHRRLIERYVARAPAHA